MGGPQRHIYIPFVATQDSKDADLLCLPMRAQRRRGAPRPLPTTVQTHVSGPTVLQEHTTVRIFKKKQPHQVFAPACHVPCPNATTPRAHFHSAANACHRLKMLGSSRISLRLAWETCLQPHVHSKYSFVSRQAVVVCAFVSLCARNAKNTTHCPISHVQSKYSGVGN